MNSKAIKLPNRYPIRLDEKHRVVLRAKLNVADIILTEKGFSPRTTAVSSYQKYYGFGQPASDYTHAALYVGDLNVIHSTGRLGVHKETLENAVGIRNFVVLRAGVLTPEQTLKIAETAESLIGAPYDRDAIIQLAARAARDMMGKGHGSGHTTVISDLANRPPESLDQADLNAINAFICSDLVYSCYNDALGPFRNPLSIITPSANRLPAEFFTNPSLQSVLIPSSTPAEDLEDSA